MASPFLYFADERLSPAELSAACLDGDLVELGDAYIPADAVETRALRAGSLRGILGSTIAATHLSAAWIHGALSEPPARHTVQRAVSRRLHHVMGRRFLYRDLAVDIDDLLLVGGVWVTTPGRTLADLSRIADASHVHAAQRLAETHPGLRAEAIAWLDDHRGLPGRGAALATLREAAAHETSEGGTAGESAARASAEGERDSVRTT
ncbi:MAG: hypothetical protein ABWY55_07470 [Microbacterium sp.]